MAAQVPFLASSGFSPPRAHVQLQPGVVLPVNHLVQQVVGSPVNTSSTGHLLAWLWWGAYSAVYVVVCILDGRCHGAPESVHLASQVKSGPPIKVCSYVMLSTPEGGLWHVLYGYDCNTYP